MSELSLTSQNTLTPPQLFLSIKTGNFVDKTAFQTILSIKTPDFVNKIESTGISYIIP